uniref:Uncharacterized protein n=1 Tax=Fagus sylvatica TaxID=28930 RepID=A0A2N9IBY5_FAGSY
MRHIVGKLSTSSFQRYKVCARIGVRTRELWLPEVGVSELFSCTLPVKIPIKRGMLFGEPRVPRRSRSHYLSNAPGLADQLVASRKDSAREGGSCAAYFCKVPDSRESELGLVRYGPASRVHRGVFGPFEGSFPIRIPADPDKFLAIREFHVVHGCVLFPMCPGSQINLLRVRKTLCASAATSLPMSDFDDLGIVGKLALPTFQRYRPCTEASLGSQDMILRTGGRRNVPYAKGGGQFDPVFGLVNGPVKPWSNLVNLGQTWSNLVKALQTLGNVSRTSFQGFLGKHIAGKLSTSSFQRYEVCVNRSSDERVMAPGSRGIGAVFVHLSGEDSDQMGDAFGKPRVPRRSWSRYLSNAPGLVDQLVASRKDSAREGGCPGGKTQATGVFLVRLRAVFRSGFRLDLIKSWRSESSTSCMSVSSFQRTRACGSTCCESGRLCAQAWQRRWEDSGNFSTALFRQPVFTRMVDIAPDVGFRQSWYRRKAGATYFPKELLMIRKLHVVAEVNLLPKGLGSFDHNFLVSRPFWARQSIESKLSLRSSEWSGSGQFDSVFGLVNSQVKPWSNLVNLGRVWSKLSNLREMYPEPRFEGFWARWTPVGLGTARSNLGQTSVNPGQTWSTLVKPWEMCPGPPP